MNWKVKFFQTKRGEYPVKEFIKDQDEAAYAKILHSITLLKDYGPYLRPPYSKKIHGKLFELRISGKIAIRIFYTMTKNEFYLIHAFKKKGQKTLSKEIETALDRMKYII